ncbi:MAG: response regulator [Polyangiaceae bacterium]|nr:response regulator [Polyangiaceae bacterium]
MSRILVVEDSETVRDHVRRAVEPLGHTIVEAADGVEGLKALSGNADAIDAIVLDVNMPRMSGIDMLERIHRDGKLRPTLVLTSEADPSLIERAKAAGAKGWLLKPIKPQLLASAIERILRDASVTGRKE